MIRQLMVLAAMLAFDSIASAQTLPAARAAFYDSVSTDYRNLKKAEYQALQDELAIIVAPYSMSAISYGGPFGNAVWSMTFVPDSKEQAFTSFDLYSVPRSASARAVANYNVKAGGTLGTAFVTKAVTVTSDVPPLKAPDAPAKAPADAAGQSDSELDHVVLFKANLFGDNSVPGQTVSGQIAVAYRHGLLSTSDVLAGRVRSGGCQLSGEGTS